MNKLIWIVDDDLVQRQIIREILTQEGFETREFDGPNGVVEALSNPPALILLDVRMPHKKGTQLCGEIRGNSDVPIIFVSSANDPVDRVVGLELGADDYINKPFHPKELAARVHALLRRTSVESQSSAAPREGVIKVGTLSLDPVEMTVDFAGEELSLTKTEFRLLQTFMEQPGKVFTRQELMKGAYDGTRVSRKTIDSHIRRLRSNFADYDIDPLRTVRGVGYALIIEALEEGAEVSE
ncbi:response regulator transcription factor [Bradymonas sediminis]|uniref:Two-component system response regulator CreB n=1 Tax=Bradymonas sediminis TaxID=1548548 RepID=A0A2Z4FIB4_9DELT|nr:response regulator transcription factor [Bradymonas sediminis]AWV88653.1 two-component system response regulator CreB [Bradymonas sediminis]TDP63662.1 two-component system OmpR family response regulator [Bradymonas sediminis]